MSLFETRNGFPPTFLDTSKRSPSLRFGCSDLQNLLTAYGFPDVTPMRLWSMHPRYLDRKGLLGVWREGLLAQKVLLGQTKGYRNHPQLRRFRPLPDPLGAIGVYLQVIYEEGNQRGYRFDRSRIVRASFDGQISCTRGQPGYEWNHLRQKLMQRDPGWYRRLENVIEPEPHPLFRLVDGAIEAWEVRSRD